MVKIVKYIIEITEEEESFLLMNMKDEYTRFYKFIKKIWDRGDFVKSEEQE